MKNNKRNLFTKMKKIHYLLFTIGSIFLAGAIVMKIQEPAVAQHSLFDELQKEPITELVLETDLGQLFSNTDDAIFEEGKLTFFNTDTTNTNTSYTIKVQPRGVTRKRICDFPPLKLRFSKTDLEANRMSTYSTLKLVTHCKDGADFEQILLKEYTAYKMYNALTEKSFRVQLVKITYVDASLEIPSSTHYGFLIENKKEMADRLGAKLMDKQEGPLTQIDANQYRLFALFQYMIGNTDWNLSKQHNLKLLVEDGKYGPLPVPYDFDFAGLVDAPYAKPYPTLPIKNVKQRFFQYRGKKNADFSPTYDLFNTKKAEIMRLHTDFNLLDESVKREMTSYLSAFFDLIEAPRLANEELLLGGAVHG
ncbi:MAG: hypothetical protein ACI8YQ_001640 [Polaribacter sp.]